MQLNLEDIRSIVGDVVYDRGLAYMRSCRVLTLTQRAGAIDATVRGSGRNIYAQEIAVSSGGAGFDIAGHCSCPVGYNCKHVAAVLIEALSRKQALGATASAPIDETAPAAPAAIPDAVAAWLQRVESAAAAIRPPPAPEQDAKARKGTDYRLIFVLAPTPRSGHASLSACKARLRVNGEIAAADQVRDLQRALSNPPGYIRAGDEDLLRLFIAMQDVTHYTNPYCEPKGIIGAQLLRMLLDQQKLLWANSLADLSRGLVHPLKAAPLRRANLVWQEDDNRLRLAWRFEAQADNHQASAASRMIDYVLITDPPWYVDNLSCGELILLHDGDPVDADAVLALVAQTPALDRKHAFAVSQQMVTRGLAAIMPLPARLPQVVRTDVAADMTLHLDSVAHSGGSQRTGAAGVTWADYAMLLVSYDGQQVTLDGAEPAPRAVIRHSAQGIEKIIRDHAAERAALQLLADAGLTPLAESGSAQRPLPAGALGLPSSTAWLRFAADVLPVLEARGWHIRKMPGYRFDLVEVEDWYAEVGEESGNAWFDLELGIVVNQARVSLLPVLVALIRGAPRDFDQSALAQYADADQLLATLPGGARVALPWGRIKPILNTLGELYFADDRPGAGAGIRLSTLDAARLAELADGVQLRWLGGERLRAIGKKLNGFGGLRKCVPPQGLRATLRDYQGEGVAWLQFLREYDLAGILADDMGLGKTIQALAHILIEKEAGRLTRPALVIAPTSLMSNWQEEAARFAPDLRVLLLHGKDRLQRFDAIDRHDLVLTTYALLPRDEEKLREHSYHLLILDEAHYIKNARSKAAQSASLLRARHRICLTGTPLENHLGELWSQFHFLLPGLLGDEKTFNSGFRGPIEKQGDELRRALLIRRIKPFLLRRTKDKVAKELPPKTEMVRTVELSGAQRDLYETVRLAMDKKVRDEIAKKGVARSQIVILEALLKLRQVCCDPRLVKSGAATKPGASSAKLTELIEMLDALLEEGRRILIFSQFTSMLALIEAELDARGIAYALLTGDTRDRAAAVRSFQQGEVPIFLISLKAGGVGLNLTAADTVIHYDPWWNPAAENQASDRAWRIGQDKPVFVYKLIAKGTLEEKIQALQQKKADLARAMLSDGVAQDLKITQDDLQAIFAPLQE